MQNNCQCLLFVCIIKVSPFYLEFTASENDLKHLQSILFRFFFFFWEKGDGKKLIYLINKVFLTSWATCQFYVWFSTFCARFKSCDMFLTLMQTSSENCTKNKTRNCKAFYTGWDTDNMLGRKTESKRQTTKFSIDVCQYFQKDLFRSKIGITKQRQAMDWIKLLQLKSLTTIKTGRGFTCGTVIQKINNGERK